MARLETRRMAADRPSAPASTAALPTDPATAPDPPRGPGSRPRQSTRQRSRASTDAGAAAADAIGAFTSRWLGTAGRERATLFVVGGLCLVLGVVAIALPGWLLRSMVPLLGVLLIGSGLVRALQCVPGLGNRLRGARRRSVLLALGQVGLDLTAGLLLLNHHCVSVQLIAALVGVLFLAEALILAVLGLKAPSVRAALPMLGCALGTGALGVAALLQWGRDPILWVSLLVGLKLLFFGAALVTIAWTVPRVHPELLYQSAELVPQVAEAYAVYFGTAFHLGVYIGHNEVVHYLNDNHVYRVSWEEFRKGRPPQHWTYPDLPPVAPEVVIATALAEVGKTYPYSLWKFNCENFAIYCKSGGLTKNSKFAQIGSGFESVELHPVLGMVAELNTRVCEWLAFQFGGGVGMRVSLAIRQLGATVNVWLLTRGARRAGSSGGRPA